jgi:hypothetical protein
MWPPIVAPTRIIRTPATGPEPANTLAFIAFSVPFVPNAPQPGNTWRGPFEFLSEFRIDGYRQADFEWHRDTTVVSSTARVEHLLASTDLTFEIGVEWVAPRLMQADGALGFAVGLVGMSDDDAIFSEGHVGLSVAVSAWILCYEPRAELPPPGTQRTPWAAPLADGVRLGAMIRRFHAVRATAAAAAARKDPCG